MWGILVSKIRIFFSLLFLKFKVKQPDVLVVFICSWMSFITPCSQNQSHSFKTQFSYTFPQSLV